MCAEIAKAFLVTKAVADLLKGLRRVEEMVQRTIQSSSGKALHFLLPSKEIELMGWVCLCYLQEIFRTYINSLAYTIPPTVSNEELSTYLEARLGKRFVRTSQEILGFDIRAIVANTVALRLQVGKDKGKITERKMKEWLKKEIKGVVRMMGWSIARMLRSHGVCSVSDEDVRAFREYGGVIERVFKAVEYVYVEWDKVLAKCINGGLTSVDREFKTLGKSGKKEQR